MHIYVDMYVYMYIYICAHICTYMNRYIYKYSCIHDTLTKKIDRRTHRNRNRYKQIDGDTGKDTCAHIQTCIHGHKFTCALIHHTQTFYYVCSKSHLWNM